MCIESRRIRWRCCRQAWAARPAGGAWYRAPAARNEARRAASEQGGQYRCPRSHHEHSTTSSPHRAQKKRRDRAAIADLQPRAGRRGPDRRRSGGAAGDRRGGPSGARSPTSGSPPSPPVYLTSPRSAQPGRGSPPGGSPLRDPGGIDFTPPVTPRQLAQPDRGLLLRGPAQSPHP